MGRSDGGGGGGGGPRSFLGKLGTVVVFMSVLGIVGWGVMQTRPDSVRRVLEGGCEEDVGKSELIESVRMGAAYMMRHQNAGGTFDYEFDWKTKKVSDDDNAVRQAGAVWGLATMLGAEGPRKAQSELREATARGLRFFDAHAGVGDGGGRFPVYFGKSAETSRGEMGTVALVTLGIIDYLRALPPDAASERATWTAKLTKYLSFLESARTPDGLWFSAYDQRTGLPQGNHSPYFDGEALLAVVMAAKYMGRDDLRGLAKSAAAAGHRFNVDESMKEDPDSDVTKGYYQWASMAYYELATAPWAKDGPYGEWLFALADWMIDVHQTLKRTRNTGYAFEGLASAYALAKTNGDTSRAERYRCVTMTGLARLMSWQVGNSRAKGLELVPTPEGLGGVQNEADNSLLRIDVTQHQMHATMLAERYLY